MNIGLRRDANGAQAGTVCFALDVSLRMALEKATAVRLAAEAAALAKTRQLALLCHEIRNPLVRFGVWVFHYLPAATHPLLPTHLPSTPSTHFSLLSTAPLRGTRNPTRHFLQFLSHPTPRGQCQSPHKSPLPPHDPSPQNGILGNVVALDEEIQGTSTGVCRDILTTTLVCVNQLRRTVDDMLDMSKIEEGKLSIAKEEFKIESITKAVVSQARGNADIPCIPHACTAVAHDTRAPLYQFSAAKYQKV